jgi:pilus assembly protein Flp/PilA
MISQFTRSVVRFLKCEDGPTAVEYAVVLALIIVMCVSAISALADPTNASFTAAANGFNGSGS